MKEQWMIEYEEAREQTGLPYGHEALGKLANERTRDHYAYLSDISRKEAKEQGSDE